MVAVSVPVTNDLHTTLRWMREGTAFALGLTRGLSDGELRGPSALPGWTRAHVVAHLALNAEAVGRLATWARTGVQTPMYPSRAQRDADIESFSTRHPRQLRAALAETANELGRELAKLQDAGWAATVRTSQGTAIPATALPWLRARETWLHGVDLAAGAGLAELPRELLGVLLDDVAGELVARPDCPSATLRCTDRIYRRQLGGMQTAAGTTVLGSAAELLGWLTGRDAGAGLRAVGPNGDQALPRLPRWL
jgi:maleylpyruvate isomerase